MFSVVEEFIAMEDKKLVVSNYSYWGILVLSAPHKILTNDRW